MVTGMTMAEKILARAAGKSRTAAGEFLDCKLDGIMAYQGFVETHHSAQEAGLKDGLPKVFDKKKVFLMVEHHQPATNLKVAERGVLLRQLAKRYELEHFYDTTCGICHQIMVDKGHSLPGELVVGTDSHAIMYGALNCASTGIGETDSGYAFTFGELWFQVPESIQITLTGTAPAWPVGKDVMLYLAGKYGVDMALYKSIEFVGPGVKSLTMDNRFTMADQGVEIGAKFTIFEHDETTRAYLSARAKRPFQPVSADPDAVYAEKYTVDLSSITPQVAAPHSFGNVKPVEEHVGVAINQACIGSCSCHRHRGTSIAYALRPACRK